MPKHWELPKEVPTIQIAGQDFVLVPLKVLQAATLPTNCVFTQHGKTYEDWLDAMDRYFRCLLKGSP